MLDLVNLMTDIYSGGEESDGEVEDVEIEPVIMPSKVMIVKPENRRTSNIMSEYEMAEYVSIRTLQIASHNNCFASVGDLDDPQKMAERELMQRKCPLRLRRYVGEGMLLDGTPVTYYEDWSVTEMAFAIQY